MNIPRPFNPEYWVEYEPQTPIMPGQIARANAAQAAVLVENDRVETRLLEIDHALSRIVFDRAELNARERRLREEAASLRAPEVNT